MKYIVALIVLIGFVGCRNKGHDHKGHDHKGHDHTMLETTEIGSIFEVSANSNSVAFAYVVRYSLHHWESKHCHSHDEARHFSQRMRHLGCEVHASGLNVSYKCSHERSRSFHSHHDADNFKSEMRHLGFRVH